MGEKKRKQRNRKPAEAPAGATQKKVFRLLCGVLLAALAGYIGFVAVAYALRNYSVVEDATGKARVLPTASALATETK